MDCVAIGTLIAGKVRVEREIGRGGMGVVFAATHIDLEQPVAVKVLVDHAAYDRDAITRFIREARAVARIQSEHVTRVMDVGVLPDGGAYIVMELLEGMDLADYLHDHGPLPVPVAVGYILEACDALAAAHARGIVHRDLKPANLFLARRQDHTEVVKVLDFGVSKILDKSGEGAATAAAVSTLTQPGQIFGSPNYMSPEQLRSAVDVDGHTDIWALGIVLHELITGKLPFAARSLADMLAAVVRDPPESVSSVRPGVPVGLDMVVARCLEKEPENRYSSVGEFARALLPFATEDKAALVARIERLEAREPSGGRASSVLAGGPTSLPPRAAEREPTPDVASTPLSRSLGSTSTASLRSSRRALGLLALGAVALGVGVFGWVRNVAPSAPVLAAHVAEGDLPVVPLPPPEPTVSGEAAPLPSAAPPAASVDLDVRTSVKGARVLRGEEVVGTTPCTIRVPRGAEPVVLRIVAEGYVTHETKVVPDVDRRVEVELRRASSPGVVRDKPKARVPGDLEPF